MKSDDTQSNDYRPLVPAHPSWHPTPPNETDNLDERKTFIIFRLPLKPYYNYREYVLLKFEGFFFFFSLLLSSHLSKKSCLWRLIENKLYMKNIIKQSAVYERIHHISKTQQQERKEEKMRNK